MAVHLFKVGQIWHYRYQVGSNRVQRSTRLRSEKAARPVAERAYKEALTWSNGGAPVPTLAELIARWQRIHGAISSAKHLASVDIFARLHLYGLGAYPINALTTEMVELARNEHLATHAPATADHWLRILKLLVGWAVKRNIIPALPWNVKMLKPQKRPRTTLAVDVVGEWFGAVDAAARAPAVATAVRLMFGLGLRAGEAAGARWEWLDWQRATYTPGVTKGREADPVPAPPWLLEHLAPLRKAEGLIAPRADGTQYPEGFARQTMRAANEACKTRGVTPHRLRGTFATMLSEAGVPIQTLQRVLRHKSPLTTMAYLEVNFDTVAAAQGSIASNTGLTRRESGEGLPASPHESSLP